MSDLIHLHEYIKVYRNMINTGLIVRDDESFLINCGQGSYDIINDYFNTNNINLV